MLRVLLWSFCVSFLIIAGVGYISKKSRSKPLPPQAQTQSQPLPPSRQEEPPVVKDEPGDHVEWYAYPKQKGTADSSLGRVLTDIEQHLPQYLGSRYRSRDYVTWGHETTHGISSDLTNRHSKNHTQGFYCLEDRAAFVEEPKLALTNVAPLVPQSLRKNRYKTYVLNRPWNNTPTYLLDEWTAYLNGAEVLVDLYGTGRLRSGDDRVAAPVEMSHYVIALLKAIDQNDPNYAGRTQMREFVAFNLRRAARLWSDGHTIPGCSNYGIEDIRSTDLAKTAEDWFGREFCEKYVYLK